MGERVSRAELAKRWGITTQAVDKLFKDGRLVAGDDRKVDWEVAQEVRGGMNQASISKEAEAKALGGQKTVDQQGASQMLRARLHREVISARHKELQYKKAAGEVIDRTAVKGEAFEAGRAFTNTLRAWPARLSGEIAAHRGLSDREFQRRVRDILDREVKRIVADVTKALDDLAKSDAA